MDSESPESRELGCWDGSAACSDLVTLAGNLASADDFEPGEGYRDFLMDIGYGKTVDEPTRDFWLKSLRDNYSGDEGKRRICMAAVALSGRDGLHERLAFVQCPVLWLQVCDEPLMHSRSPVEIPCSCGCAFTDQQRQGRCGCCVQSCERAGGNQTLQKRSVCEGGAFRRRRTFFELDP